MKRKSIALLLLFLLLLSSVNIVSTAETTALEVGTGTTTISSINYSSYTGSNSTSPMYAGSSFTYTLNIAQSGMYKVSLKTIVFYNDADVSISWDGRERIKEFLPRSETSQITELGIIDMSAGINSLTVKTFNRAIYFSSVILERVGDRTLYTINSKSYVDCSAGVTNGDPRESLNPSSSADYSFTPEKTGTYGIWAELAALPGSNAELKILFDGTQMGAAKMTGISWTAFQNTYAGRITLTGGQTYTIRAQAGNYSLRFSSMTLRYVSPETEQAFLTAAQQAQTTKEMESVLTTYGGELLVNYADHMADVFYKEVILSELLAMPHESLAETDAYFLELVKEEEREPIVTVLQNEKTVQDVAEGALVVNIGARFSEDLTAIAALYLEENNQLYDIKSIPVEAYSSASITELAAPASACNLRIFFFKDYEVLKPVDLPLAQSHLFVAPNGSDSATGSIENPLASLSGAAEKAKALNQAMPRDITVLFAPGTYFVANTVTMDESYGGQNGYSVNYRSQNPESPATISGGLAVSGWNDSDDDGIYELAVPETVTDLRQLYIDDMPARRARGDGLFRGGARWDNPETDYEEDGFVVYNRKFPVLERPEDVELCYSILWTVQRLPVEDVVLDIEAGTATVKMDQPYYSNALTMICDGGVQPVLGSRFYLENDLVLLDEPGEFYYNKETNTLYYMPYAEENLNEVETVIGQTEQLIFGKGTDSKLQNVSFDGLNFRYGGYYTEINEEGSVSFQAECIVNDEKGLGQNPVSVGSTTHAQLHFENAENISFTNCDIACMGSTALRLGTGVTDSEVTGCLMRDISGSALSIGSWKGADVVAQDITISNNVITRPGIDLMYCPAISIYYTIGVDVLQNTVFDTPYSGVSLNWGWAGVGSTPDRLGCGEHTLVGNRIYNISQAVRDGGHIYNLGYMKNVLEERNYFSESTDFGGIYFDTGSAGVTVNQNVVETTTNWIFGGGSSANVIVTNNFSDTENTHFNGKAENGCSIDGVTVCENSQWTAEAQAIVDEAGVEEAYKGLLAKAEQPTWRKDYEFNLPKEEVVDPRDIYVPANEWTSFTLNPADASNKTKPAVFYQNGFYAVGDLRAKETLTYTIPAEYAGTYTLTIDYTTGPNDSTNRPKVNIFLNNEETPVFQNLFLPRSLTSWSSYIPYTIGEVELKEGDNILTMANLSIGFAFRGFNLSPKAIVN